MGSNPQSFTPFAPSDRAIRNALNYKEQRQFGPQDKPADGNAIAPNEKTVTMVFPHDVLLTNQSYKRALFKAGVREVPESLADHPYLEAHGVKRHTVAAPTQPVASAPPVDLASMTKAQLIDHAKEAHDLDLDPADKKEDLIAQIADAQKG